MNFENLRCFFDDLGVPKLEVAMAKAKIAMKIYEMIKLKKLTQAKTAKILKISQPKTSLLFKMLERLLRFLNDLGQDVYISIVPCSRGHGNTWVGDSPSQANIAALRR